MPPNNRLEATPDQLLGLGCKATLSTDGNGGMPFDELLHLFDYPPSIIDYVLLRKVDVVLQRPGKTRGKLILIKDGDLSVGVYHDVQSEVAPAEFRG